MKFKIIFFIFLLTSCSTGTYKKATPIDLHKSTGFALIYSEEDYEKGIVSGKLNNEELQIAHNRIKKNSIVKITNPQNNKSVEIKIYKKINYPNFFNIVITKTVSDKLGLNQKMPFVDIQEKIKNKSFVAKKAVTFSEEQKVSDKAPVTKVKIKNISVKKKAKKTKHKKFSIIVGEFYSQDSAMELKNILEKNYVKKGVLKVEKLGKNKFTLLAGPYTSINTLKSRYFELNKYGFEYLDIKQND